MKLFLNGVGCTLLALSISGCGSPTTPIADTPAPTPGAEPHDEHDHGAGPHGGTIGEWGGGAYHIEFTVDHDKQESTVYILGGDVKTPAPIKASKLLLSINEPAFQVELVAQPLEGEADGMSSRFVGQHESLGKVQEFAGSITGEVDGTPYAGDFKEEAGHHDEKGK
jgi:hypothetical protein